METPELGSACTAHASSRSNSKPLSNYFVRAFTIKTDVAMQHDFTPPLPAYSQLTCCISCSTMASSKSSVYISEDGSSTLGSVAGPSRRQATQDAHESVYNIPDLPIDIEHQPVKNDPKLWSNKQKVF